MLAGKIIKFLELHTMDRSKKLLITVVVVGGVGLASLAASAGVFAQNSQEEYPPIVQRLSEAFGLNPTEVHEVFEETHDVRRNERLDSFVEDGVLTEEQRAMVEEKMESMHSERKLLRDQDLTSEERRTARQEIHEEMETWAEENDIPLSEIGGFGMRGGESKGGFGEGMGMRESMGMQGSGELVD